MLEKRWIAVPPQAFTLDGTVDGKITVSDSALFKVKQVIILASSTKPSRDDLEIKRITDENTIYVGPKGGDIDLRTDVSGYLVADGAFIAANEQQRSKVPEQAIERLTYEEEPVVARRVVMVDTFGKHVDWGTIGSNGLAPSQYDDVQMLRNGCGEIVQIKFFLNTSLVQTLNLTYDGNSDLIRVKKV